MTYIADQEKLRSTIKTMKSVLPHLATLRINENENTVVYLLGGTSGYTFKVGVYKDRSVTVYALKDDNALYYEIFTWHSNGRDESESIAAWDGIQYGMLCLGSKPRVELYDHLIVLANSGFEYNHERDTAINAEVNQLFKPGFTEEEHFQMSMLYDLMSFEDCTAWYKVLTEDLPEGEGTIYFNFNNLDLIPYIEDVYLNILDLVKRSYD